MDNPLRLNSSQYKTEGYKKPFVLMAFIMLILTGCVRIPEALSPVADFRLDRYLGHWYEIARLDHSFERGLNQVTADYSLRSDGGIKVINRGYSERDGVWHEAEGKGYFVQDATHGFLKVSFFGPFYGSYVVFDLDHENYQYALIAGPDRSYFWLLARTPTLELSVRNALIAKAKALGFQTDQLIFPTQSDSGMNP